MSTSMFANRFRILLGVVLAIAALGIGSVALAQTAGDTSTVAPPPPPPANADSQTTTPPPPPPPANTGGQVLPPPPFNDGGQMMQGQNNFGKMMPWNQGGQDQNRNFGNFQGQDGGPNNQGRNMMDGNDDDRFEKEQSRMEAEQAKREAQRLKMMALQAKQMAKGLTRPIARFKTQLATLSKRGLSAPSDCKTALEEATSLVSKLQNSASFTADDDGEDLFSSIPEVSGTINECSGIVSRLLMLPNIMKTAKTMLDKLSKGGGDTDTVQPEFDDITNAFTAIKNGSASSDDIDNFFANLDTFRSDMESAFMEADIAIPSAFKRMPKPQAGMQNGPHEGGPQMMPQNFGGDGGDNMPRQPMRPFRRGGDQDMMQGAPGPQSSARDITPEQSTQLANIYETLLGLKKLFR